MRTADAIIGREWEILEHYGFTRTGNKHIDCPICGKAKKFRINEYNGRPSWICVCGNGGIFDLLIEVTEKSFADLAKEIDALIGNLPTIEKRKQVKAAEKRIPIPGTETEKYLQSRGITILPKYNVYHAENVFHRESGLHLSAMYSVAVDHSISHSYSHLTFLQNGMKAKVEPGKKVFTVSRSDNVSIRMFDVESCLGVSEGIETALSAKQLYGVPVWSCMNSAILKKFRAPRGVRKLIVYADNDKNGAGLAAAFECGHRNILSKNDVRQVSIKWPETGDFNDHLRNPIKVYEWKLS